MTAVNSLTSGASKGPAPCRYWLDCRWLSGGVFAPTRLHLWAMVAANRLVGPAAASVSLPLPSRQLYPQVALRRPLRVRRSPRGTAARLAHPSGMALVLLPRVALPNTSLTTTAHAFLIRMPTHTAQSAAAGDAQGTAAPGTSLPLPPLPRLALACMSVAWMLLGPHWRGLPRQAARRRRLIRLRTVGTPQR